MHDRIEKLELFKVPPRWLFLKITTAEGICGWGEPVVEGRADTVAACVRELEPYILGRDPEEIEDIWTILYRGGFYRGGAVLTSALSGIDQALWDIKGKRYGVPVYNFFGGKVRDRVEVYSHIGGHTPEDYAAAAKSRLEQGYRAIKFGYPGSTGWLASADEVERLGQIVQAIRDAVGSRLDIGIDFHGRVAKPSAKALIHELEPFHLMFIEEPVLTENAEDFRDIASVSSIPIATGERNYTRWGFKQMLTSGAVDIIQPDPSHAGGISECRKIGAMAEAFDVAMAPHCPLGPVAFAVCLQIDLMTYNSFIQEQALDAHDAEHASGFRYIKNRSDFKAVDGYVPLLTKPGLGIEMDEETVRREAETGHTWKNEVDRAADGSFTEW